MNLVLVESPTKARTLSKFLGDDYRIESTMGHVRDLPKKKFGISVTGSGTSIKITPDYELIPDKKDRVDALKKLADDSGQIILATDPDREGEAIAWHVAELLKGQEKKEEGKRKKEFQRVVFHQITKNAILDAVQHPRNLDMNLVDAQQGRRILDRMVGYKLSPLLWKKIRRGLSAGRVQSVAVRLVVDREREIEKFVSVEYWEIYVGVEKAKDTFSVKLVEIDGKKAELSKKEQIDPIVSDLETAAYRVGSVDQKEVRRGPYPPFTTSTLQQAASRLFRWSGKKTMSVAQQLYEHGFITYHRTDSFNLAQEAISDVRKLIPEKFGTTFLPENPRFYKAKAKAIIQEAHEAIRVTNLPDADNLPHIESTVGKMGKEAVRLYQLIWRRFVACQMADQVYDQTTVSVDAKAGVRLYRLQARGQVEKFSGWHRLYEGQGIKEKGQREEGEGEISLPEVTVGDELRKISVKPEQHFTIPPGRYTEAMLIKMLEFYGIGRPSTYAPIISTIQDRGYVEKQEARFHPLPVGIVVTDFLAEYFPQIVDYDFTRGMEEDLDRIASGERPWQEVLGAFWSPFEEKVKSVEDKAERMKVPVEETGEHCPECNEGMQVIRTGRFGKFLSCSRFPNCKWTEKYVEKIGMKCPMCGVGDVIVKKTRKGKQFFGCSRYPDCKFASWKKPKTEEMAKGLDG